MPLPAYKGPYQVGVIDLEIPVRRPRAYAADIVEPSKINKPGKKKKQQTQTSSSSSSRKQTSLKDDSEKRQAESKTTAEKVEGSDGQDGAEDDEKDPSDWSPLHNGSKTSTLYFATVLFAIYYPSSLSKDQAKHYVQAAWLGRPKKRGAAGLANYLGQYGLGGPFAAVPFSPAIATLIAAKSPALCGAPLASPDARQSDQEDSSDRIKVGLFGSEPASFPIAIFSHGLAGSRLAYSQYCGELASQGVVVAAVEHRDGSGLQTIVRPPQAGAPIGKRGRLGRSHYPTAAVPYFDFTTIGLRSFATDPSEKEIAMRQAQMSMRAAEIDECLHVLRRIGAGEGDAVAKESTRSLTTKLCGKHSPAKDTADQSLVEDPSRLKSWQGKLDIDLPVLIGHSFGGATVLQYFRRKDSPFPCGMLLDPWVEPVVVNDNHPDPIQGPLYTISSASFTQWKEHFDKVKKYAREAKQSPANPEHRGWLVTLAGSEHLSFSDYPLLLPRIFRSTITPGVAVDIYARSTLVQMGLVRQRMREREDRPGHKFPEGEVRAHEEQKQAIALGKSEHVGQGEVKHAGGDDILNHSKEKATEKGSTAISPEQLSGNGDAQADPLTLDDDVAIVVSAVRPLATSQLDKKYKMRSLLGMAYRYMGAKPGMDKPGSMLIHDPKQDTPASDQDSGSSNT